MLNENIFNDLVFFSKNLFGQPLNNGIVISYSLDYIVREVYPNENEIPNSKDIIFAFGYKKFKKVKLLNEIYIFPSFYDDTNLKRYNWKIKYKKGKFIPDTVYHLEGDFSNYYQPKIFPFEIEWLKIALSKLETKAVKTKLRLIGGFYSNYSINNSQKVQKMKRFIMNSKFHKQFHLASQSGWEEMIIRYEEMLVKLKHVVKNNAKSLGWVLNDVAYTVLKEFDRSNFKELLKKFLESKGKTIITISFDDLERTICKLPSAAKKNSKGWKQYLDPEWSIKIDKSLETFTFIKK